MPQMAPMNWLTLFLFFISIYIIFNSFNYFSLKYNTQLYSKKMKLLFNWKW
uniref:ATP synthase complex subunit 8 n=1 Tax=Simianus niponicus TaxID=3107951 RepID=A0A343A4H3_9COLE|nr:ATP synthase F0 subunit 8 [Simianus niponicus]AOY39451.1 ATP synthase F0 subunit 8 [Simianus niponicus]